MEADPQQIYFWDEKTGLVVLRDRKTLKTTDGGESWKGIVAP